MRHCCAEEMFALYESLLLGGGPFDLPGRAWQKMLKLSFKAC